MGQHNAVFSAVVYVYRVMRPSVGWDVGLLDDDLIEARC